MPAPLGVRGRTRRSSRAAAGGGWGRSGTARSRCGDPVRPLGAALPCWGPLRPGAAGRPIRWWSRPAHTAGWLPCGQGARMRFAARRPSAPLRSAPRCARLGLRQLAVRRCALVFTLRLSVGPAAPALIANFPWVPSELPEPQGRKRCLKGCLKSWGCPASPCLGPTAFCPFAGPRSTQEGHRCPCGLWRSARSEAGTGPSWGLLTHQAVARSAAAAVPPQPLTVCSVPQVHPSTTT